MLIIKSRSTFSQLLLFLNYLQTTQSYSPGWGQGGALSVLPLVYHWFSCFLHLWVSRIFWLPSTQCTPFCNTPLFVTFECSSCYMFPCLLFLKCLRASIIIWILQSSFEKLHNLIKFTQLVSGRAGIWTQGSVAPMHSVRGPVHSFSSVTKFADTCLLTLKCIMHN